MIRAAFLETATECRELVASRDAGRAWDAPSALAAMTVGECCGHLARATLLVAPLLSEPLLSEPHPASGTAGPAAPQASAAQYFLHAGVSPQVDGEANTAIRARAHAEAAHGQAALVGRLDDAIAALPGALAAAAADRVVVVRDEAMLLDEYLVTRIVEMVVHLDDLAVSLGRPTPEVSPTAMACTIGCLLEMARMRHGDLAVVRALARRERDAVQALRVL